MKILIIGGSGFLGWNLSVGLKNKYEIISTYYSHNIRIDGVKTIYSDITDLSNLEQNIHEIKPDLVINCAGMTKIKECEVNPQLAFKLNCESVFNLSLLVKNLGIQLIHFSTDLVYSGNDGLYSEDSPTKPSNIYGKTKLFSEMIVENNCINYMIFRLALLYGCGNGKTNSFVDWIETCVKNDHPIRLYGDQYRSMLYVKDAVKIIDLFIQNKISNQILNMGGNQRVNRFEFGVKFLELFYSNYKNIINASLKNEPDADLLGFDCSMKIARLQNLSNFIPRSIIEGLNDMKLNFNQPEYL